MVTELGAICAMCASVVYFPACQTAKVPNVCKFFSVPINVLKCANYSTWCAKMPKRNQFFNLFCQNAYRFSTAFQKNFSNFKFFNYSQHSQISRIFQEYFWEHFFFERKSLTTKIHTNLWGFN